MPSTQRAHTTRLRRQTVDINRSPFIFPEDLLTPTLSPTRCCVALSAQQERLSMADSLREPNGYKPSVPSNDAVATPSEEPVRRDILPIPDVKQPHHG